MPPQSTTNHIVLDERQSNRQKVVEQQLKLVKRYYCHFLSLFERRIDPTAYVIDKHDYLGKKMGCHFMYNFSIYERKKCGLRKALFIRPLVACLPLTLRHPVWFAVVLDVFDDAFQ
jgi:hypothetical protein